MKDLKISDELLCEILRKKVSIWGSDSIGDSVIEIGIHLPSGGRLYKQLNIYEVAFKCKEWALKKEFIVHSSPTQKKEFTSIAQNFNMIDSYYGKNQFYALTEIEAILKACNWILEQNK